MNFIKFALSFLVLCVPFQSPAMQGMAARSVKRSARLAPTMATRSMHLNTAYSILNASSDQSLETIKKKHLSLVKRYHPDLNLNNQEAASKKMKEINAAFDTIKQKHGKRNYEDNTQEDESQDSNSYQRYEYQYTYEYQSRGNLWLKGAAAGGLGLFGIYKYIGHEEEPKITYQRKRINDRIKLLQSNPLMRQYEKELQNILSSATLTLETHEKKHKEFYAKKYKIKYSSFLSDQEKKSRLAALEKEEKEFLSHSEALAQLLRKIHGIKNYLPHREEIIKLLTLGADPTPIIRSHWGFPEVIVLIVEQNDHELLELVIQSGGDISCYPYHLLYNAKTPLMAYHLVTRDVDLEGGPEILTSVVTQPTKAAALIPFYVNLYNILGIPEKESPQLFTNKLWQLMQQYGCREYTDSEPLLIKAQELHKAYPALGIPGITLSEAQQQCIPCVKLAELMKDLAAKEQKYEAPQIKQDSVPHD